MRQIAKAMLVILCATNALGQDTVPHTFEPGTPAKASEVNNNFQIVMQKANDAKAKADTNASELETVKKDLATLDGGGSPELESIKEDIVTLKGDVDLAGSERTSIDERVKVLEQSGNGNEEEEDPAQLNVSHTVTPVAIGSLLQMGEEEFRVMKIPFIDLLSGDRYSLQLPLHYSSYRGKRYSLEFNLFSPEMRMPQLIHRKYKAQVSCSVKRIFRDETSFNFYLLVHGHVNIRVGDTVVSLRICMPESIVGVDSYTSSNLPTAEQSISHPGPDEDYDLTDNSSYEAMNTGFKEAAKEFMDEYIDYIKIEKVSP